MTVGVKTPQNAQFRRKVDEMTKKCAASKQCTTGRSADVLRQHSGKQTNRPMRLGREYLPSSLRLTKKLTCRTTQTSSTNSAGSQPPNFLKTPNISAVPLSRQFTWHTRLLVEKSREFFTTVPLSWYPDGSCLRASERSRYE